MTADAAREMVRGGVPFGDVFPLLADADRAPFREWFVQTPGVPNLGVRRSAAPATGDVCRRCGGANLARTGTCLTCQDCGESSGGCG